VASVQIILGGIRDREACVGTEWKCRSAEWEGLEKLWESGGYADLYTLASNI